MRSNENFYLIEVKLSSAENRNAFHAVQSSGSQPLVRALLGEVEDPLGVRQENTDNCGKQQNWVITNIRGNFQHFHIEINLHSFDVYKNKLCRFQILSLLICFFVNDLMLVMLQYNNECTILTVQKNNGGIFGNKHI